MRKGELSLSEFAAALKWPEQAVLLRLKELKRADTCERCGGSGSYSFSPMYGTVCFGCGGVGYKLPRLTKELVEAVRKDVVAGKLKEYFDRNKKIAEAKKLSAKWFDNQKSLPTYKEESIAKEKLGVSGWMHSSDRASWLNGYCSALGDAQSAMNVDLRGDATYHVLTPEERARRYDIITELHNLLMASESKIPDDLSREITEDSAAHVQAINAGKAAARAEIAKLDLPKKGVHVLYQEKKAAERAKLDAPAGEHKMVKYSVENKGSSKSTTNPHLGTIKGE